MSATKEIIDQAAHLALGAALALPVAWHAPPYLTVLVGLLCGVLREDAQHRPHEGWGWMTQGSGRWLDIAMFGIGSLAIGFF